MHSDLLAASEPTVIALGGGAVLAGPTRDSLRERAFTVLVEVEPDAAWERIREVGRPLAKGADEFRALYLERQPVYDAVADGRARDLDGIVLAAAGVHVQIGALDLLADLVPGGRTGRDSSPMPTSPASTASRPSSHSATATSRRHEVPPGEAAKAMAVLERLWRAMRIGRDGTIVGLGGGCATDLAGFAAATYMRGVDVGRGADVARRPGGRRDRRQDRGRPAGGQESRRRLSLAGSRHHRSPACSRRCRRVSARTAWPRRSRRDSSPVSRCGSSRSTSWYAGALRTRPAFACATPTIAARATSSISGTRSLTHWRQQPDTGCRTAQAVALGMVAALRLSGNEEALAVVRRVLAPKPVRVDRDAAWAALARDKKARAGSPRLVLLEPGAAPRWGVEVPAGDVRAALDDLIAGLS